MWQLIQVISQFSHPRLQALHVMMELTDFPAVMFIGDSLNWP